MVLPGTEQKLNARAPAPIVRLQKVFESDSVGSFDFVYTPDPTSPVL